MISIPVVFARPGPAVGALMPLTSVNAIPMPTFPTGVGDAAVLTERLRCADTAPIASVPVLALHVDGGFLAHLLLEWVA